MKLIIDIDISPEELKKIQTFNIKMMDSKITHKIYEAVQRGIPVSDIINEQISDAFQAAIATYWEEKSKYLTPPPKPAQCRDCSMHILIESDIGELIIPKEEKNEVQSD